MPTANATCYFPTGEADSKSQPCNPDAAVSHCCWNSHLCLSNGLCWDTVFNHIIRVTCTDASWTDARCPQYCKDDTTTVFGDMRQCNGQDTNWVCGIDPSNCTNTFTLPVGYIDDNRAVSLSAVISLPSVYTAATATGSAPVTTVTTTMTATAAAASSDFSKNCNATTVGIGAGLGAGIPLLAALLATLFLLRRALKKLKTSGQDDQVTGGQLQRQANDHPGWQPKLEADSLNIYEVADNRI